MRLSTQNFYPTVFSRKIWFFYVPETEVGKRMKKWNSVKPPHYTVSLLVFTIFFMVPFLVSKVTQSGHNLSACKKIISLKSNHQFSFTELWNDSSCEKCTKNQRGQQKRWLKVPKRAKNTAVSLRKSGFRSWFKTLCREFVIEGAPSVHNFQWKAPAKVASSSK